VSDEIIADVDPAETIDTIAVFAPTLRLSVTIECTAGVDELHVHPAGQGWWVARMLLTLGERPLLCAPIGGETGDALRALLADLPQDGLVPCPVPNSSYVHDRRGGERVEVASIASPALGRHVEDDLVSSVLAFGLASPVVVVCGSNLDGNITPEVYERVCHDLRVSGVTVVADLSGDELRCALAGGVDLLKVSHEELGADGWTDRTDDAGIRQGIDALRAAGAVDVVVSCGKDGVVAAIGERCYRATSPEMSVVDHRGAGDSMTAALAAGLRRQAGVDEMLRLAVAAGAANVTRHGLASGHPAAIAQLARLVRLDDLVR
jgi:1-phosphofructokinase